MPLKLVGRAASPLILPPYSHYSNALESIGKKVVILDSAIKRTRITALTIKAYILAMKYIRVY